MFLRSKLVIFISIITSCVFGQEFIMNGSEPYKVKPAAALKPLKELNENWNVQLKSFTPSQNKSMLTYEELKRLKREANAISRPTFQHRSFIEDPKMNINFEGNVGTGGVPPDNTIAVSDNGFIVTSINSNIIITRADKKRLYNGGLGDFFSDLGLGANFFDPKVLFDAKEKKFIVVALSGSKANVSNVVVAFSNSEDPSMGWSYYKLKGDILSEGVWFDYPNIGINDNDLFVCGNMFTDENMFKYSSIYQIDKKKGYSGKPIDVKHYTKMKLNSTSPQNLFNLTPCPAGWSDNAPTTMGFLTNDIRGGNKIVYCEINGAIASNPIFAVKTVANTNQFDIPQDATMKISKDKLETFDCRIMYGFTLNGVVHYVFKTAGNNFSSINYGRLNLATNKITEVVYSEDLMHVSYPSIIPFGKNENESKVLINYLRSNGDIFPEQAAVLCEGEGNNFTFSKPILIKSGEGIVVALDGDVERWGDYTSVSRRFWNNNAEVWAFGCFGRARFGSWTAQILDKNDTYNDFFASKTVINPNDTIAFSTLGLDTLTNVTYTLESGVQLPGFDTSFMATYTELGSYDVRMNAVTTKGDSISILKKDFINVVEVVYKPVADFSTDKTNIFEGDSIKLTDLSINKPTRWKWTCVGGKPAVSELQNPYITYPKKGTYTVVLTAKNSAGENVVVKQKLITVSAKPLAPVADFIADKAVLNVGDTVTLSDLSKNNPTSWQWLISNASKTDTFYVQNPKLVLSSEGSYNVTLTAKNDIGENKLTKENYLQAIIVATKDELFVNSKLYPNPVSTERVVFEFELSHTEDLAFELYDINGVLIKKLIKKEVKSGRNELSFNTDLLQNGNYKIVVSENGNRVVKVFGFVVMK